MNRLLLIPAFALLGSCDRIGAVGDKMDELKDARQESTNGAEGMEPKAITEGTQNAGPVVQDIGQVDFQTFISEPGRLNVVAFHADWCGPCRRLGPVISSVIEAHSGVARLGRVNVDQTRPLSTEQGVRSIPDVRFYIDGKLVHRFTGGVSKEKIENLIATHSAKIKPTAAVPPQPKPPTAKPIEEAIKPMEKEWLPPGMSRK